MADTTGRVLAAPQRASKIRCWPSATLGKPETFDFLGFTHCCSTKRNGDFQVLRLTAKKRMRATLLAIRDELQRRRVMSPSGLKGSGSIGWLAAISTTTRCRATCSALTVFGQLSAQAASPQAVQPDLHIPIRMNASRHEPEAGAVCGSSARTDLCEGVAGNCHPYRDPQINGGGPLCATSPDELINLSRYDTCCSCCWKKLALVDTVRHTSELYRMKLSIWRAYPNFV